jgi:hypothetical protein
MRKVSGSLLVAAMIVLGAARAQAEAPPRAVERTHQAVVQNGADIMAWVYPTVRFDGVAGCEWVRASGGFVLGCRFDYVDTDGSSDFRLLRFRLNPQGFVTRIEDGGGGSIVPAFVVVRVTQGLAAKLAQDELAHRSGQLDADKRALLRLLAESPEPEEILAFLLNLAIVVGA